MTLTVCVFTERRCGKEGRFTTFHDPERIPAGLLLRIGRRRLFYHVHEDVTGRVLSDTISQVALAAGVAVRGLENLTCPWFSAPAPTAPTIAERFYGLKGSTVVACNYALLQEFAPQAEAPWSRTAEAVAYVGDQP